MIQVRSQFGSRGVPGGVQISWSMGPFAITSICHFEARIFQKAPSFEAPKLPDPSMPWPDPSHTFSKQNYKPRTARRKQW